MMYRPRHSAKQSAFKRMMSVFRLILLFLIVVMLAYPFVEPLLIETEYVTLTSADLPRTIGTLRIVYLSDIHYGSFFNDSRLEDLVSRVNALNADIVLLGGDYADDSSGTLEFFRKKPNFQARIAVCGVLGNHDRTIPETNLELIRAAMHDAGFIPLVNEVAQIRMGVDSIYVAGVDDINNGHPEVEAVASQVKSSDYVIYLAHSPEGITAAQKAFSKEGRRAWYDLGLFGHTHGGQIAFFGNMLKIANVPKRYQSGWIQENRIDMLISRGVGTSVLPMRLFRRPQIHVITVKSDR